MARAASGGQPNNPLPSAQELLASFGNDARSVTYGLNDKEMVGVYNQMHTGRKASQGFISPLASLPTAAGGAEFYEAIEVFEDDDQSMGYYDPSTYKFDGELGGSPVGYGQAWRARKEPAPLTLVPTSTINPERPRTVAAGYDKKRGVLTVVFRDGTYYNYYDVEPDTWARFKSWKSKGRFIAAYLNAYDRGYADVRSLPAYAQEALYRITRTSQVVRSNRPKNQGRPWQQINRGGKLPYPKRARKS